MILDYGVMIFFLVAGIFLNMATWYHPAYFLPVVGFLLICLPIILVKGLNRPWLVLWLVLLAFFTQDSFPNNVMYETYYGYEAATIYFHNFLGPLSVFDILLLSSLYVMTLRHLKAGTIKNLFSGRVEYYVIGIVISLGIVIGLLRNNEMKNIFAEIQPWVYGLLMYWLVLMTLQDRVAYRRTLLFIVLLLSLTIPLEFLHYITANYHSLLAVVGRIRKPLLNGTDDTVMVWPVFILLAWVMQQRKQLTPGRTGIAYFFVLAGLAVIYLNIGRALALFTLMGLVIFFLSQRLNWRIYLIFGLLGCSLAGLSLFLQPAHLQKLTETFTSVFAATQDLKKDMSAGDRVVEFFNVHETLKQKESLGWGLGWGGIWEEYYYQPGRGSLASYADKTLTSHRMTHVIFSNWTAKCGYLGMILLTLSFLSLWIHFIRTYRQECHPDLKAGLLGMLFAYPVFLYFSLVFQTGITFVLVIALMRKAEILSQRPEKGEMDD